MMAIGLTIKKRSLILYHHLELTLRTTLEILSFRLRKEEKKTKFNLLKLKLR
jgi:hypothetical protein